MKNLYTYRVHIDEGSTQDEVSHVSKLIINTITHNHPSPTVPSWCESNQCPTKQLFSEKNAEIKRNLATLVTDPIHNPLNASLHLGESSK